MQKRSYVIQKRRRQMEMNKSNLQKRRPEMENRNPVTQKHESADRPPEPRTCFLGPAPLKEAVRQSRLEKQKSVDQNEARKLENRNSVDQKHKKVDRILDEKASLLRRQGTVVATWRNYKGRKLGPYYKLTYREQGRQHSVYIGADKNRAEHVHQKLKDLQQPLRQRREMQKLKKEIRRELARSRAEWNRELIKAGLYLKGSEVRGWREFPHATTRLLAEYLSGHPENWLFQDAEDNPTYPFPPLKKRFPENRTSVTQKRKARGSWGTSVAPWTLSKGEGFEDNPNYPVTPLRKRFPENRDVVTQKRKARGSWGTSVAPWTLSKGEGLEDNPTYPVTPLKKQFPENGNVVDQKPDANVPRGTSNFPPATASTQPL